MTNEELDILGTLQSLNNSGVTPDKGRIFTECAEYDTSRRYDYYGVIDELITHGLIEVRTENYESAALWRRYLLTSDGAVLLKAI